MSNEFGLKVTIDASGSQTGAREFQRSADAIAHSAKSASEGVKSLHEHMKQGAASGFKEALEGATSALESMHKALAFLGVGAVTYELKELLEAGKEIEDEFIHLQIVTRSTADAMEGFRKAAVAMSNTFGNSQLQTQAAQIEAARSGYGGLASNTKVATAAIELSKVAFTSTANAASLLTRVMQSYGASAGQAKNIAESLFIATRAGKLDIDQLGQVFARIEPFVQSAGLSINDILATLSALGQTGQDVRVSMYGMQQVLRSIADPTPQTVAAFDTLQHSLTQMGVHALTLKQLVGQEGLQGALTTLYKAAGGNQQVLENLFGAMQAGATVYSLVTQGGKYYAQTLHDMKDKTNQFDDAYKKVMASVAQQTNILQQHFQNSYYQMADVILKSVGPAIQFINEHFNGLRDVVILLASTFIGRLIPSLLAMVAEFGTTLVSMAEMRAGMLALAAGAEEVSTAEIALAGATGILEGALALLGGPVGILVAAVSALGLWIWHLHSAKDPTDALIDKVNRLGMSYKQLNLQEHIHMLDQLTEAMDRQQNVISADKTVASRQVMHAIDPTDPYANYHSGMTVEKPLLHTKKLDADLKKLNEIKDAIKKVKQAIISENAPDITGTATKSKETNLQQTLDAEYTSQKSVVDGVTSSLSKLKSARDLLKHYEDGSAMQGAQTNQTGAARLEIMGKLREEIYKTIDGETAYQQKLQQEIAKTDPVVKANEQYTLSLRDLRRAALEAGVSTATLKHAEELLAETHQKTLIAAKAKLQEEVATNDASRKLISTTAQQQEREVALTAALKDGTISRRAYTQAMADGELKIESARMDTEALTAGQMKLAKAVLAMNEAQLTANREGLSGAARTNYLATYVDAVAQAAAHTDALSEAVDKLRFQFDPLAKAQDSVNHTMKEFNRLESERPDLAGKLQAVQPLAQLSGQKDLISASVLPKNDKTALLAMNEYATTVARLKEELKGQVISQNQFNQALLEAKQNLNAAQQSYDTYTKAVIDGGKAVNDALGKMFSQLDQRGTRLRDLFHSLATALYSSASNLLSHKLQQDAYSKLANSGNSEISKFGQNLASGAGISLIANGNTGASGATLTVAGTTLSGAGGALMSAAGALSAAAAMLGTHSMIGGSSGMIKHLFSNGLQNTKAMKATESLVSKSLDKELGSALGSSGGGSSGGSWLGKAASFLGNLFTAPTGGHFTVGQTALVGERGPEMVTFGGNAQVHANDQVRQAVGAASAGRSPTIVSSPQVHVPVQVVNVDDPKKVPDAMQGAEGSKAILNVLSQNRSQVKSILG